MWMKDAGTEQLMDELGMEYKYVQKVPIKELNVAKSLGNNARTENPLDALYVAKYSHAMKKGTIFPAIVLIEDEEAGGRERKYLILAGNQRTHAAMDAERTTVDAYIVKPCSEATKADFLRLDNNRNGLSLSVEDQIQSCVWMYLDHNKPLTKSCDEYFGGDSNMYTRICAASEAERVTRKLHERAVETNLKPALYLAMHPIMADINVLCDVAHFAEEFALTGDQVKDLVKEICKQDSESDRHAVIIRKKGEMKAAAKTGVVPPEAVLRKHVFQFRKFLETGCDGKGFPAITELVSDKKQAAEIKEAIEAIIRSLGGVYGPEALVRKMKTKERA